MSAKRTSWNEFSSTMASAVICLSTGRKFNFSKYIFDNLVRNVDNNLKFNMYPMFIQLIIQNQLEEQIQGNDNAAQGSDVDVSGDDVQDQFLPSPAPPTPPSPPQDIPSTSQDTLDACAALTRWVEHLEHDKVAQDLEITK
nr:hypothetical protein [Tanacetum cinerariifolium]